MGSPHPEQDRSTSVLPSAWLPGLAPTSYSCFPFPGAPRLPPAQSALARQLLHHAGASRLDGAAAGSGGARAAARWESR